MVKVLQCWCMCAAVRAEMWKKEVRKSQCQCLRLEGWWHQAVNLMRSRLPWIGLGSRVWSRVMGFFSLLKDSSFHEENSKYFINCLLERVFLNYFYGQSANWAILPYFRSCFNIWTGIFSVHRNILSKPLFSPLPGKSQEEYTEHGFKVTPISPSLTHGNWVLSS